MEGRRSYKNDQIKYKEFQEKIKGKMQHLKEKCFESQYAEI